jgi:hypothetical protein
MRRQAPLKRRFHTPHPQSDPDPPTPGPEVPNPSVPPDMEPVVPQREPPPGRGADGEPPPVIASGAARSTRACPGELMPVVARRCLSRHASPFDRSRVTASSHHAFVSPPSLANGWTSIPH